MSKSHSFESYFDRLFIEEPKEGKRISHGFPLVLVAIFTIIFKLFFRYRVEGREKLDSLLQESGVMVVCNHASYLDAIFGYLAIRPAGWPRMIAKEDVFTKSPWIFGWLLARMGTIPIKRDSADRIAVKRAANLLKHKETVVLFPEGSRRGKGSREPSVHGGAALIARMGHAPILPMTIRGVELVKQKGKLLRFPKIVIEFGDPINVKDFNFLDKADRLEGCMWYSLRECYALNYKCDKNDVDMKVLFPTSKDFTEDFKNHFEGEHKENVSVHSCHDCKKTSASVEGEDN